MSNCRLFIFPLLIALIPLSQQPTVAQSATPPSPQGRLVRVQLNEIAPIPLVVVDPVTYAQTTLASFPFDRYRSSALDPTIHRYFLVGGGRTCASQMVAVEVRRIP
jgi:hypothetical protein